MSAQPLPPPPPPPPLPAVPVPPSDPPPEVTAEKKLACPLCGGETRWNPDKQAVVCLYCGSEVPATRHEHTGQIEEHDLAAALREVPDDQRGWQAPTRSVRCQSCGAITVFAPDRVAQRCDFCGSAALVDYQQARAPIRPESVMAFTFGETKVREAVHRWYRTRWFAPNTLGKAAFTDQVRGVYLPYWTFDAQAHCPWTAEAGYTTTTEEQYTDNNGQSQTRTVSQTRWEPAAGTVDRFFDDVLVPASKGVPPGLVAGIEPFPTAEALAPYEPSYLTGWTVEQYQIDLASAVRRSEEVMEQALRQDCSRQVPGDTQRGLRVYPEYSARTYKHVLLPVWILSYVYLGRFYQVLVNGHTGRVAGRHPLSWFKITLAVLLALALLVAAFAITHAVHRNHAGPPRRPPPASGAVRFR